MSGLGKRGQDKVAKGANQLFTKTENTENSEAEKPENHKNINDENGEAEKPESHEAGNAQSGDAVNANNSKAAPSKPVLVKKSFVISFELAEDLRKYCFENRKKEVDVVREALNAYLKK